MTRADPAAGNGEVAGTGGVTGIGKATEADDVFVLARTLAYAALFVAIVLVLLPARLLSWSGVPRPVVFGAGQWAGLLAVVLGFALALGSVLAFAFVGRGTPAPFDAPRRLVVLGPYRMVRNPMYLGAGLALAGAALIYRAAALAGFAALFFLAAHSFVRWYEEPTLRRRFGAEYDAYCRRVGRWRPRLPVRG